MRKIHKMLDVNSSYVKFEVTLDKVLNNNLKTRYLTVNQYSSVIQYLTVSVYDIYSCETITLTFSFSISNDNSIAIVDFLYIFPSRRSRRRRRRCHSQNTNQNNITQACKAWP